MKYNGVLMILLYSWELSLHLLQDLKLIKFKKYWVHVSFIAWYLSLTSTGTLKTRLPTQTKKYFCNISQKMVYFNHILQFPKKPQILQYKVKNLLSWQPFFSLVPGNLTVGELVYDKLFIYSVGGVTGW
jgi:hypothetical protein